MKRRGPAKNKWLWRGVAVAASLLLAAPDLSLQLGMNEARACLARISAPGAAALPNCRAVDAWFVLPSWAPWTTRLAALMREELAARMTIAEYQDAAVGSPERAALAPRAAAVQQQQQLVKQGSGRTRLDRLGPTIPAPDVAQLAYGLGDAASIDRYALQAHRWFTALHAIEAAIGDGKLARAKQLAAHYESTADKDLRETVGALLCLAGQADRGLELLVAVEQERADKRKANMVRNFGGVRVLIEACAASAGLAVPPVPAHGYAGDWDQRERLAVLHLRAAERTVGCNPTGDVRGCFANEAVASAARAAAELLRGTETRYRLELIAAIAPYLRNAQRALRLGIGVGLAELATWLDPGAQPGAAASNSAAEEPTPRSRLATFIGSAAADRPWISPQRYELAATRLLGLEKQPNELHRLAGALQLRAARGYAARGQPQHAWELAQTGVKNAQLPPLQSAWLLAATGYLGGQPGRALLHLGQALESATDPPDWYGPARALQVRLLAVKSRTAEAAATAQRVLAQAEPPEAAHNRIARWREALGWWSVALAPAGAAAADSESGSSVAAGAPLLPWLGPPTTPMSVAARQQLVSQAQATWRSLLAAGPDKRRGYRYAAFRHRGDVPEVWTPYLLIAGKLVERAEQTETWLDAFLAFDARRLSWRSYAWFRAEAAVLRGDQPAYSRWNERYRQFVNWAGSAEHAELFQQLRL